MQSIQQYCAALTDIELAAVKAAFDYADARGLELELYDAYDVHALIPTSLRTQPDPRGAADVTDHFEGYI